MVLNNPKKKGREKTSSQNKEKKAIMISSTVKLLCNRTQ